MFSNMFSNLFCFPHVSIFSYSLLLWFFLGLALFVYFLVLMDDQCHQYAIVTWMVLARVSWTCLLALSIPALVNFGFFFSFTGFVVAQKLADPQVQKWSRSPCWRY